MPTIDARDLEAIITRIYEKQGVAPREASVVARHQLTANLVGHDSHGVVMTPHYVNQIQSGDVVPGAELHLEHETATTAVFDGNWGFGFVQTERAMSLAIEKVKAVGTAAITIRYQGHVGRLGTYAEQAARAGMISLITSDSGRGPKSVAPFGGTTRRLGTNPICFGIPSDLPGPVILDMATSAVAVGKLAIARARGESVPPGCLLDENGDPTSDPEAYYKGGAILPLGGIQGHKGFGLSFVVEVLCGLLTGLGYGVSGDGRHNDGNFIALFDVSKFRKIDDFYGEVRDFVNYVKASPVALGHSEIFYPGEIEHCTREKRLEAGIPIEEATWGALEGLM